MSKQDTFAGAEKLGGKSDEFEGRFVSLGDGPKQVSQVEGKLLGFEDSITYPGNKVFVMGTQEEILKVASNTFLVDKLTEVGALYRVTYTGKTRGKSGRAYKTFEVLYISAAEAEASGKAALYKGGAAATAEEEDDDDLPF